MEGVYLLQGRSLVEMGEACAGAVVGVTGLHAHVVKSATLADTPAMTPFTELTMNVTPILR